MRIAFFTTRMLLGYGVDLTVDQLARRLVETHGHSVDVWTPTSDGTYEHAPYALRKLLVYGAPVNRALPLLELNAWIALRKLQAQLKAERAPSYDVVIPCTHPYYSAGAALDAPSVFLNFGNVPTTGFTWKGKLNWQWLEFSDEYLWKPRSACVLSISRFLHQQQRPELQARGRVLHLGGDHYAWPLPLDSPERVEARLKFRLDYGLPPRSVVLGFCGRLHKDHPPYKGTGRLLELARRLRAVTPDAVVALCGIGSEADAAWVREAGAVPLLNLPPGLMPQFYNAIDVYVCASEWEGFNLPLVEAAWHGVPGLAYDVGAHREHVTTILIPPGPSQFDELSRAALSLVQDPALRQRLGRQAYSRAQRFAWSTSALQLNSLLREVVGEGVTTNRERK